MSELPINPSEETKRLNPHLYPAVNCSSMLTEVKKGKRLRQDGKPSMNKLEREWYGVLAASGWIDNLRPQAKRYKLGNGIWYKPDMTGNDTTDGRETAYEVKGPHAFRGGFENLKVAASAWPEVKWILVWKENGEWMQQTVLP